LIDEFDFRLYLKTSNNNEKSGKEKSANKNSQPERKTLFSFAGKQPGSVSHSLQKADVRFQTLVKKINISHLKSGIF